MLLVIDVGNTNIVFGVYDQERLVEHWRVETRKNRASDEYGVLLRQMFAWSGVDAGAVSAAIVSCVVPPMIRTLEGTCQRYFGVTPLVVGPGVRTGMPILVENPREVGADRIVNAVAAYEAVRGTCIVVDFGTATTFDAVSEDGKYMGGAIAPGPAVSTDALFHHASKLPRVEVLRPRHVIGRNTVESMQSGIYYGYVALVDGLVERMRAELGVPCRVLATGGLAGMISEDSQTIDEVLPFLTLEGLRILWERNRPSP
ncbi:MAG: type III pantothenate kinase [Myxococcales bacterium]